MHLKLVQGEMTNFKSKKKKSNYKEAGHQLQPLDSNQLSPYDLSLITMSQVCYSKDHHIQCMGKS